MKGILFKPWKIKAIAEDDGEWQTRRVIKPQPCDDTTFIYADGYCSLQAKNGYAPYAKSRYQVGEVVYIKEAWQVSIHYDRLSPSDLLAHPIVPVTYKYKPPFLLKGRWRSPLFMPEWAARYFIKITDIRAERLQKITEEDAKAEGVSLLGYTTSMGRILGKDTYRYSFEQLWDSINPKYPWAMNPWVFHYSFKKAKK